ncbi:MAG: GNAT family N-acetyltransferase [bacterium]
MYVEKQNKIDGLIILPKYRNQGIGTYAMKVFLKKLKNEKIIRLVTHPENTPAILLYLKLGFLIK